jgi:hypothetical protein
MLLIDNYWDILYKFICFNLSRKQFWNIHRLYVISGKNGTTFHSQSNSMYNWVWTKKTLVRVTIHLLLNEIYKQLLHIQEAWILHTWHPLLFIFRFPFDNLTSPGISYRSLGDMLGRSVGRALETVISIQYPSSRWRFS